MKQVLLIAIAFIAFTVTSTAQKFGYVNTALVLQELPEVTTADAELETYQQTLLEEGQARVNAFEQDYQSYIAAANAGELSKMQMATREEALTKEQQAIQQLEQEVQFKIMQKREMLLKPILEKVDKAIQELGKEGGYTFIFDSSVQGGMLYAPEGDDVYEQLMAKLKSE